MTRDEMVRLAREAGISLRYDGDAGCDVFGEESIDVLERFAALSADAARFEGWQAAREGAAKVCDVDKELSRNSLVRSGIAISAAHIRAMQPPAEWVSSCACGDKYPAGSNGAAFIAAHGHCENCAVMTPVCGGAPSILNLPTRNKGTTWPHPDGFAGGLTERSE